MGKKSVLSTLRFVLVTVSALALLFVAVYLTIQNTYKPVVKAYIDGNFVGYFSDEEQFDEIYNDLVTEKKNIDENVKVYLDGEPSFEHCYITDSLLKKQNVYTNLRAEMKTEYTVYDVIVNGNEEMTFTAEEQANDYANKIKAEAKVDATVNVKKKPELEEITTIDRADNILADIVDRNKPVETPVVQVVQKPKPVYVPRFAIGPVTASAYGNIAWPTTSRTINCNWLEYEGHSGVDIQAHMGTPVYSFAEGTVIFADWNSYGLGYCVIVDHGGGYSTVYAHNSLLHVRAGEHVVAGQLLSSSGMSGNATGPHLHFELHQGGQVLDPWNALNQL